LADLIFYLFLFNQENVKKQNKENNAYKNTIQQSFGDSFR